MALRSAEITNPGFIQPHRRDIDLSGLSPDERRELSGIVRRIRFGGGFTPRTIRLVLSPDEIERATQLVNKVRWRARSATLPQDGRNHSQGVDTMPAENIVRSRKLTAISDLEDGARRVARALNLADPEPIDAKKDAAWDGVLRLEQSASLLTIIADKLESQPVKGKAA